MAEAKIFSIQPRFRYGDNPSGWALVEGIFRLGQDIPPYGSETRDAYLAWEWMNEPMLAGVFSTWIEKAQTVNWKITGGKNNSNYYARVLQTADGTKGWTYHEGVQGIDYLSTDKGSIEEIGRDSLTEEAINELGDYSKQVVNRVETGNMGQLQSLINRVVLGRVNGLQHLDSTRMIKVGLPGMLWRYYPDNGSSISIPDENIIQITSMPLPRDRYRGFGLCALSRCLNAKNLMVGYLNYYRQEIGDLPPELITIVNGLPQTDFKDALDLYKQQKKQKGLEEYGKIFWLGSDDPMTPVDVKTVSLINSQKSFQWVSMVEWWLKTTALNVGEDVGEFWLLQRGESKTVQSIQAMKSKGKGVARYLQEKERLYNMKIMPYGVRFEYDNQDDDADKMSQEILSMKIDNLTKVAQVGVDRQDPSYTIEEIRQIANQWDILPPEVIGEEVPATLGAMLKEVGSDSNWVTTSDGDFYQTTPWLKSDKDLRNAKFLYEYLGTVYSNNGFMQHKQLEPVL